MELVEHGDLYSYLHPKPPAAELRLSGLQSGSSRTHVCRRLCVCMCQRGRRAVAGVESERDVCRAVCATFARARGDARQGARARRPSTVESRAQACAFGLRWRLTSPPACATCTGSLRRGQDCLASSPLTLVDSVKPPLIHRDLKVGARARARSFWLALSRASQSPNVLLSSLDSGALVVAKVSDFGLVSDSSRRSCALARIDCRRRAVGARVGRRDARRPRTCRRQSDLVSVAAALSAPRVTARRPVVPPRLAPGEERRAIKRRALARSLTLLRRGPTRTTVRSSGECQRVPASASEHQRARRAADGAVRRATSTPLP